MTKIYTDGGCHGNPGIGAWAFIVYKNNIRQGSKSNTSSDTTNNQMELTAILEAIKWANKFSIKLDAIYSDSMYAVKGILEWMEGWKSKGWKTSSNTAVKNIELWKAIDKELIIYKEFFNENPKFLWVKAHAGDKCNNEVDALVQVKIAEIEVGKL